MKKKFFIDHQFASMERHLEAYMMTHLYNPSKKTYHNETITINGTGIDVCWCNSSSLWNKVTLRAMINSPAKRMYNEAVWLAAHEIEVETPIGYAEFLSGAAKNVSAYFRINRTLEQISAFADHTSPQGNFAIVSLAETVYQLHQIGVFIGIRTSEPLMIDKNTGNAVWAVNGELSVQHKAVSSIKATKDMNNINLDTDQKRFFIKKYIDCAARGVYSSYDKWMFYQEISNAGQLILTNLENEMTAP
ncbi:MAG: hypothetical protein QM786_08315 [Breznakibacter sp.]